jgi:BMFP domain-containing protein YqiC
MINWFKRKHLPLDLTSSEFEYELEKKIKDIVREQIRLLDFTSTVCAFERNLQSQMGTVRKDLEEKIKQILKKLPKETK